MTGPGKAGSILSQLRVVLLAFTLAIFACNMPLKTATPAVILTTSIAPLPQFTLSPTALAQPPTPYEPPPAPSVTPAPLPTPTIVYQPRFEPADCAFLIPPGTNPECGYLLVPENRYLQDSPTLRLAVAIFRSTSASPAPDPVVHLAGGPGSSSLEVAGYLFSQGLGSILERRDFILFDQRGTGYSQPQLDCPEREALSPTLLEGHLPPEGPTQAILEAFRQCRDRLTTEGINLSMFNSAASAADLNDLRQALGYAQINLYGVSYGTRLALTVMRDFPKAIRSAVLDSTYPPQVHLYTALAPNADRAFTLLFERCVVDPGCSTAYPDLQSVFDELVDELNRNPIPVDLEVDGVTVTVLFNGGLLIDVLFTGMYNPFVTAYMPRMIYDIRNGDYSILRERLALYFDTSTALGMQMSVQCAEEIPFARSDDAWTAAQSAPHPIASFFVASVDPLFAICRIWGLPPPDPRENLPVSSDIPALVLAGEFDPITPPDWGRLAASSLSQAYFFEFPGNGHWVTRSSDCALQMALAFWDDPSAAPDSSCIQSMGGLVFR